MVNSISGIAYIEKKGDLMARVIRRTVNICSNCGAVLDGVGVSGKMSKKPKRWKKTHKYNPWTKDEKILVKDMISAGSSHSEVAKRLKRTERSVASAVWKWGLNKA